MKEVWESTTSIDGKWKILRSAMCDNAARILGKACKRQPDWFESLLLPLFEKRRMLHDKWLVTCHWNRA